MTSDEINKIGDFGTSADERKPEEMYLWKRAFPEKRIHAQINRIVWFEVDEEKYVDVQTSYKAMKNFLSYMLSGVFGKVSTKKNII